MKKPITIEVCCASADDAVRAFQAGADRIELNAALFAGGLTPSLGTLIEARKRTDFPIICMLRPRAGGFAYSQLEFESMLTDLRVLKNAGADGFAVGCLRPDGELDEYCLALLIEEAGGKEMVFHRAFDAMPVDPIETLKSLKRLGFRRVLTSGRKASAAEGLLLIKEMIAAQVIEILPAGGIRPQNIARLVSETACDQVHFSFHKIEADHSMRFSPISFEGQTLKDDQVSFVNLEKLGEFVNQIRNL